MNNKDKRKKKSKRQKKKYKIQKNLRVFESENLQKKLQ